MKLDSATTYESVVGNRLMQNACSLKANPTYCKSQAGSINLKAGIGPLEIINLHKHRQMRLDSLVQSEYLNKLEVTETNSVLVFITDEIVPTGLQGHDVDVFKRLLQKTVQHSFTSSLLKDSFFLQWCRLSLNHSLHVWAHSFIAVGRTEDDSNAVDKFCRHIMTQYLRIMIEPTKTRRQTHYTSYETDVWIFLRSGRLRKLAETALPKSMHVSNMYQGCVMLGSHHGKNDQGGLDGLSEASIASVVQEFSRRNLGINREKWGSQQVSGVVNF